MVYKIEVLKFEFKILSSKNSIAIFQRIKKFIFLEMSHTMYVVKRDGTKEEVDFGKCQKRIEKLAHEIKPVLRVNSTGIGQQIIIQISDGIKTSELDELAASICANKESVHPDYGRLATRIIISNHHKNT